MRILCWDHPRCVSPIRRAIAAYLERRPDLEIDYAVRPLSAFNDEPIDRTVRGYDLVVFDHPMVARAAECGALTALEEVMPPGELADGVGASQRSYRLADRTYGIATDAACQVAAARADLLAAAGEQIPSTWHAVIDLARTGLVALPLYPSDAFCSMVSLSVAASRHTGVADEWPRPEAVERLGELVELVDPDCFGLNPPGVLDRMTSTDTIGYVPLLFGYVGYTGHAVAKPVTWAEVPAWETGRFGSVLGGAGLGVPAEAPNAAEAIEFARWYAAAGTQRDIVLPGGGQPAAAAVWDDPSADAEVGGFFSATRGTIEGAYARPARTWWPDFQDRAGRELAGWLRAARPATDICADLRELRREHEERGGDTT